MGYLYPVTTPVVIKFDYNWSCHFVHIAQLSKTPTTMITYLPELDQNKRQLTWTVYTTPLMTLTTDLGLSIRVAMFEYVRMVTGISF